MTPNSASGTPPARGVPPAPSTARSAPGRRRPAQGAAPCPPRPPGSRPRPARTCTGARVVEDVIIGTGRTALTAPRPSLRPAAQRDQRHRRRWSTWASSYREPSAASRRRSGWPVAQHAQPRPHRSGPTQAERARPSWGVDIKGDARPEGSEEDKALVDSGGPRSVRGGGPRRRRRRSPTFKGSPAPARPRPALTVSAASDR